MPMPHPPVGGRLCTCLDLPTPVNTTTTHQVVQSQMRLHHFNSSFALVPQTPQLFSKASVHHFQNIPQLSLLITVSTATSLVHAFSAGAMWPSRGNKWFLGGKKKPLFFMQKAQKCVQCINRHTVLPNGMKGHSQVYIQTN